MEITSKINGNLCTPLGLSESSIDTKLKDNEIFKEEIFTGSIIFINSDYDYLVGLDEFSEVEFTVYQDGTLIITAYFQLENVTINKHVTI